MLLYVAQCQLNEILASKYSHIITRFFIVDCRYPYEFDGGHIPVNFTIVSSMSILITFHWIQLIWQMQANCPRLILFSY